MNNMEYIKLYNGVQMPTLGYGVFLAERCRYGTNCSDETARHRHNQLRRPAICEISHQELRIMKQVSVLVGAMARKACGAEGVLHGFTDLTPADVEKFFRMCL